jgi:hypothetical protein
VVYMCIYCAISSVISAGLVVAVLIMADREKRALLRMIGCGSPDAPVTVKAGKTAQARALDAWRNKGK